MKDYLIRITTVPISLEKLLEGQLNYMQNFYKVLAVSSNKINLNKLGTNLGLNTYHVEMSRKITPFKDLLAVFKLFILFKKKNPKIVHTHTPKAGIVGMMAAYLAGVPLRLHTVAGLPLMETTGLKRHLLNFVEKLTYNVATNVYPNSKGLNDFIINEGFAHPSKLKIIGQGSSNGIDSLHFDPSKFTNQDKQKIRQNLNIGIENFVFIFVGRLVGDKGINELIEAFNNLNFDNSKLLLVGPLETELDPLKPETLASISTNVDIISVGYQQDVRPFFAVSNALVFPSYREGFPNVVMQAGAMGLPSIVSDINGCNEIIINGENGVIIPPKNVKALKDAMLEFVEKPEDFTHMTVKSRHLITSRFERKYYWNNLLDEYQQLVSDLNIE